MQDAARNQAQDGFFAADNQRVAGIVPALEADHAAGLLGQPIHNLAFAFVAPLRTDDHYVLCHINYLVEMFGNKMLRPSETFMRPFRRPVCF